MRAITERLIAYPVIYLVMCALVPSCVNIADKVILYPQPSEGAPGAVQIFAGEPRVELWRVPHPSPKAYVVRFYGNGDLADRWVLSEAHAYADLGIELWAVNYPGYGASVGPATLSGVARAAEVAFDTVRAHAGELPVIVLGSSLGTTAALHVTATRPAAGAILENPPALREMIMREFGWWNLWILASQVRRQIPPALDSVANARASTCPVLVVSSTKDEVVRAKYHTMIYEAYAGPKDIIRRADAYHNTPLEPDVRESVRSALAHFAH